jgi:hypothetical protein
MILVISQPPLAKPTTRGPRRPISYTHSLSASPKRISHAPSSPTLPGEPPAHHCLSTGRSLGPRSGLSDTTIASHAGPSHTGLSECLPRASARLAARMPCFLNSQFNRCIMHRKSTRFVIRACTRAVRSASSRVASRRHHLRQGTQPMPAGGMVCSQPWARADMPHGSMHPADSDGSDESHVTSESATSPAGT